MTPEQAVREAEKGMLRPVYLLMGQERFLTEKVLSALRAAAGGDATVNNEEIVNAAEISPAEVIAKAKTLPMFSPRRVVIVRQVERWEGKTKKESPLDQVAAYAQQPSESCLLILVSDKLDKRRRLVSLATKSGFFVDCGGPKPRQLPTFIRDRSLELGHTMDFSVAELLAELVGPSLSDCSNVIERLSLFVGPERPITEEAVGECVVRIRAATVWELVSAVERQRTDLALGALHRVFDPADRGLRLVSVLAWSTRQLLRFQAATARGLSPKDSAKEAGVQPFKAQELSRVVMRLNPKELENWLVVLGDVDNALKGGSKRPPRAILEQAVIRLCSRKKRRANHSNLPARP